jgi:hypothetical protein
LSRLLVHAYVSTQKELYEQKDLFSQDCFTPHWIVNCARSISNDIVTADTVAAGLRMSFATCFQSEDFQRAITLKAVSFIQTLLKEPFPKNQNNWIDLCLMSVCLEYFAIQKTISKLLLIEDANSLLSVFY